jgi:glutamate synthase (NADPH/NADH) small chain
VKKTGKRVAVVGSGPAGMACAQQLARAGHAVTLFEKNDRIGGLLRYGIPDFKMEKHLIDRRMRQMEAEGVEFRTGVEVGATLSIKSLLEGYDAVALTGGAEWPRDLEVPGRDLGGVHFAMDFLVPQNKRVAGDDEARAAPKGTISAKGKHVVVIGGGDTGSDCVGTSNRHGAASVTQLEVMPQPPERENKALTWPDWPLRMRTSSSHEEGAARDFAVLTKRCVGKDGKVTALDCVRIDWVKGPDGRMAMVEVPGSTFQLKADLVLLAMGFLGPRKPGMLEQSGVALDARGNIAANVRDYRTSVPRLFSAGDMRRGQSLVVWAIREGRQCARSIDEMLMGSSTLPR